MSGKFFAPVLFAITAIVAVTVAIGIPDRKPAPPVGEYISPPAKTESRPVYEIKLTDRTVCLYTYNEQGEELERKPLGYINIYSLADPQLSALRAGARFETREAVAEFIQDLDS